MVTVINYADEKFKPYQKLQTQTAYYFGADKVVEYSPADIDKDFYAKINLSLTSRAARVIGFGNRTLLKTL